MFQQLLRLFHSSSIYTIGNVLNRALFLISMPIMTRYLQSDEYGTLSIINAITGIMMTFYGLGAPGFMMRYYYEFDTKYERKLLIGSILPFVLVCTFFMSVLLTLTGGFFFQKVLLDIPFIPYMLIGIWTCFFSMFGIFPNDLFRILGQPVLFISVNFLKSAITISLSILSVVVFKRGAEGPLCASMIVAIFSGFYFIYYLKDKIKLNINFIIVKKCLKFSLPLVLLLLGRSLLDSTDRLILQRLTDLSFVAFYSVGSTMGSILVMVASSINSAMMPFFFSTAKKEIDKQAKEIFSYISTYICLIVLFLGLLVILFRFEIIYILAPPSYFPIIGIVPYIMIGAIMNSLFFIPVLGIYQKKKTGCLPFIIFSALLINILLNFALIPNYQMLGAAIATVVASFVMLLMCFIISQKLYHIPYQYHRLLKICISCILCYLFSVFVQDYTLVVSIFLKSIIVLLFPLFLYSIRFFEPRELEKIKHLFNRCIILIKLA